LVEVLVEKQRLLEAKAIAERISTFLHELSELKNRSREKA
jgi:hypothetical protein